MDPDQEALIRFGYELSQMGMRAECDPGKIAKSAGLECKVITDRDHKELDDIVAGMRSDERQYAEQN